MTRRRTGSITVIAIVLTMIACIIVVLVVAQCTQPASEVAKDRSPKTETPHSETVAPPPAPATAPAGANATPARAPTSSRPAGAANSGQSDPSGSGVGESGRPRPSAGGSVNGGAVTGGGERPVPGSTSRNLGGGAAGSSRLPPVEDVKGKIRFEGRWIEAAVKQRREELLARRAWVELADYVSHSRDDGARMSAYADDQTTVAAVDERTFVVAGVITTDKNAREDVIAEVSRDPWGGWKVAQVNGKKAP